VPTLILVTRAKNAMAAPGPATLDHSALSNEERIDWLRLIRSENVGPRSFRSLLRYYGTARRALAQLPDLARRGGAASVRIRSCAEAERELAEARTLGVRWSACARPNIRRGLPRSTTRRR
jgi:DNA processing protein